MRLNGGFITRLHTDAAWSFQLAMSMDGQRRCQRRFAMDGLARIARACIDGAGNATG